MEVESGSVLAAACELKAAAEAKFGYDKIIVVVNSGDGLLSFPAKARSDRFSILTL